MENAQLYLQRCLELASKAAAEGESPVGCVIVKEGKVLGEGYEKSRQLKDITRHAEVLAMLDATDRHGKDACSGAVLYSNVEPCVLCSYIIRHHRIVQVVYMQACGDLGGAEGRFKILLEENIKGWGEKVRVEIFGD